MASPGGPTAIITVQYIFYQLIWSDSWRNFSKKASNWKFANHKLSSADAAEKKIFVDGTNQRLQSTVTTAIQYKRNFISSSTPELTGPQTAPLIELQSQTCTADDLHPISTCGFFDFPPEEMQMLQLLTVLISPVPGSVLPVSCGAQVARYLSTMLRLPANAGRCQLLLFA